MDEALSGVRSALGGRKLVWFGIRGEDGEALLPLSELQASFSVIATLRSGSIAPESNVSLETSSMSVRTSTGMTSTSTRARGSGSSATRFAAR